MMVARFARDTSTVIRNDLQNDSLNFFAASIKYETIIFIK